MQYMSAEGRKRRSLVTNKKVNWTESSEKNRFMDKKKK